MRVPLPWGVQSYKHKSPPISSQELINLFAEKEPANEKTPVALLRRPGYSSFGTVASKNRVRAFGMLGTTVYCVIDNKFYSVSTLGTLTELGTLNTTASTVEIAASSSRMAIVDGSYGYWYTVSGGFAVITDADLEPPRSVTHQDGWFIFVKNDNTGQFQIANDTDISALEFATAESEGDVLLKVISDHRELWLFGSETIEIWWNSGNADFTFERVQGAYVEQGLGAQRSVAKFDNTLAWLGDDGIIYRADNYTPMRISTHAIEADINGMSDATDAVGYSYTWEGHEFYVISFPTGKKTYTYDASTGLWHRQGYFTQGAQAPILGQVGIEAVGYGVILGDRTSGTLYSLDDDVYSDNGSTIVWEVTAPQFENMQKPGIVSRLQVDFEAGVSLETGQGSSSKVMLQISRDGGKTWGNEMWRGVGDIGDYEARTIFRRLGHYRKGTVFRLRGSDPIKVVQASAFLSVIEGTDGD